MKLAPLLLGGSIVLGASAASVAADAPAPSSIPAEAFTDFAEMYAPQLSPDGSAIAVLMRSKEGRRNLAVVDTDDIHKARIVAAFTDQDIGFVRWVNNQRLVFSLRDETESAFEQRGNGLWAIDRDASNQRLLIYMPTMDAPSTGSNIKIHTLSPVDYRFGQVLRDGTDDVIVEHQLIDKSPQLHWWVNGLVPLRLDTRTGSLHEAIPGHAPDHVFHWSFDDQGHARAAISTFEGKDTVLMPTADGQWEARTTFPAFGRRTGAYDLLGVGADGHIYVEGPVPDEFDSQALYRLDDATAKPESKPILYAKGFDIAPQLVEDQQQHRVIGVHYQSDAHGTAWFDKDMAALQAKVDAHLPGLINRIDVASCGCAKRMLVTSSSDRQPPFYTLYDRSTDTFVPLGFSRHGIDAKAMADTDFVRIKARDGHDLPLYVTKPHGKGPWPAVVLVHGGPYLRVWSWDWEAESQFLASRGYLVVRPEFRGSEGFGAKLYLAGLKQWGLKMQDDIADATVWASDQGLADRNRVCISGGSYGGYAALMGLVRYPDLYRCGVAAAAVTDIGLMFDLSQSDASPEWKEFGMTQMIGDPVKDAEQLKATSPLLQAAKITHPLLLVHGGIDRRVPIEQATRLRDALESNHAPVTWVQYTDEAHGWSKPTNRADFFRREADFLAANIGPGAAATPVAAASGAADGH